MAWLYTFGIYLAWFSTVSVSVFLCRTAGGWINTILQSPNLIPKFGKYYHYTINRILGVQFLFSLTGIFVAASGVLIPFLFLSSVAPFSLSDPTQICAALTATTIVALRIMSAAWYMETWDYIAMTMRLRRRFQLAHRLTRRQEMELARTNFADTAVQQMLTITICYGLSLYCASRLGWLGSMHDIDSPFSGITEAVYLIRILWGPQAYATTLGGYIIHGFYGLSLLIYTALFISLSSKLVDETVATLPPVVHDPSISAIHEEFDPVAASGVRRWDHSFPHKQDTDHRPHSR